MTNLDWLLTFLPLAAILGFAFYTRRFVKSVADYTSAGRCAGRYLICNARAEADSGLSNAVAMFQQIMVAGFVLNWWGALSAPLMLVLGIVGFVIYRYRETRVLTLPQLFEVRYSRKFRLFMGILAFLAGLLNYGIFPAVASKFFVYFLQLPQSVQLLGLVTIRTDVLIMAGYLTFTLVMMLTGGQIALMVTDCVEGIFSHVVYLTIVAVLLWLVPWSHVSEWLVTAAPNKSPINPFDAKGVKDFNVGMWAMGLFTGVYITMAWQNRSGFNSAGRNAHETRMGGVLGNWRGYARTLMLTVLVICAMTYLNHPQYQNASTAAREHINQVGDEQQRSQATVTIALSHILPSGIRGLFLLVMIMGLMAADASHMHSWGSIFIQDVVLPMRKTAMDPQRHIWAIRCAQIGVALFAFVFSASFTQTQYIAMWWAITGTVFQAGAGAAIIGGLYWKKGTTAAAWAAAITGSAMALGGIAIDQMWGPGWWGGGTRTLLQPFFSAELPAKFPLNGITITFCIDIFIALLYIAVSLLTCRENFNMDRLLHRGKYAVEEQAIGDTKLAKGRFHWTKILGFDENFTFWDKVAAGGIFWWTMFWFAVVLIGTAWNLWHPLCLYFGLGGSVVDFLQPWPKQWWASYWFVSGILLPLIISAVTLVWFSIGGFRDLKDFFVALRTMTRDHRDDGRVVGHHNLADEPLKETTEKTQPATPSATH